MNERWKATHVIEHDGDVSHVMLCDDGCGYQAGEWEFCLAPDYAVVCGKWYFQGRAFNGIVRRIGS
ncbi:hypothetical protein EBR78_10590 [bacterium]|nr:hypothetical protein [bacterium]